MRNDQPDIEDTLNRTLRLKDSLEEALCSVVKLIEMAEEVDKEEWGQEVWDENAADEVQELRECLQEIQEKGEHV